MQALLWWVRKANVIGLVSALGAIIGPSGGPSSPCGGCYVIADVTGVVFGTEVIYQTVGTQINSVATGRNGSVTTFTSFVEDITPFTFGPNGLSGTTAPAGPITIGVDSSIAIISGLTLYVCSLPSLGKN